MIVMDIVPNAIKDMKRMESGVVFNLRLKDHQIKDAALGIGIIRSVCSALIDGLKQPMVVKK